MEINLNSLRGRTISEVVDVLNNKGYRSIKFIHITKLLDEKFPKETGKEWQSYDIVNEFHLDTIRNALKNYLDIDTIKNYFEDFVEQKSIKNINIQKQSNRVLEIFVENNRDVFLRISVYKPSTQYETSARYETHVSIVVSDESIIQDTLSILRDSLRGNGFFTNEAALPQNVLASLHRMKEPYYYLLISTDDSKRRKTIEQIIEILNETTRIAKSIKEKKGATQSGEIGKLKILSIKAENYRNLDFPRDLELSINTIVVGENDSGKTSLLRLIHMAVKLLGEFVATAENFPKEGIVINFNDELGAIYEKSSVKGFIQSVFDRRLYSNLKDRIVTRDRVKLELRFSAEGIADPIDINFEIAYIDRNLRVILKEESIQNVRKFGEQLKNLKSIYIDTHVIPKEEDINVEGESLKKYLLRMLNIKNYSNIARVIANVFEKSELEDIPEFDTIFESFEIYRIEPEPEDWKIKLKLYYLDTKWRSDIMTASDEKSLLEFIKTYNLEEYYKEFERKRKIEFKDFSEFKEKLIEHIDAELKTKEYVNFDISEVGQGLKDFIFLVLLINFLHKEGFNSILLLDEPFLHMHPQMKSKAMDYVRRLCRKYGIQLIYTTHESKLIPSMEEEGNSYVLLERKITKDKKMHKRYEVKNEYNLEKIFLFLKTLGYIEAIQRQESYNHIFLVEGKHDIYTYTKIFRLYENDNILAFKIFSKENIKIIPMFIGAILYPTHEKIGEYNKFKDFMRDLKISILLDGDYLSASNITYKAYMSVIRCILKNFLSQIDIENNELKLNISVLPVYSQENLLLYLVKDIMKFDEEGIRKHINGDESKIKNIKDNIRNDLIRLKSLIENLKMCDENEDIKRYKKEHDEKGISGFINEIFRRVQEEPLKYFKGKDMISLLGMSTENLIYTLIGEFHEPQHIIDKIGRLFPSLRHFLKQLTE